MYTVKVKQPTEHFQINERRILPFMQGMTVKNQDAVMPWHNAAKDSIVSLSRKMVTLITTKKKRG